MADNNTTKEKKVSPLEWIKKALAFGKDHPEIQKAIEELTEPDATKVEDLWTDGNMHKTPDKKEVPTGPSQDMSGKGAQDMTKEYSTPAPQKPGGLTQLYEQFGKMVQAIKAISDQNKVIMETFAGIVKADDDEKGKDAEEKCGDGAKKAAKKSELITKAEEVMAKARKMLKSLSVKAVIAKATGEKADVGLALDGIAVLIKSVLPLLNKAAEDMEPDDLPAIEKAATDYAELVTLFKKAEDDGGDEDDGAGDDAGDGKKADDDKDEKEKEAADEEKAKKAAKKSRLEKSVKKAAEKSVKKSETKDADNQGDETKDGMQAGARDKETDAGMGKSIEMVNVRLDQLFDVIMGKTSKNPKLVELMKSNPAEKVAENIYDAIAKAETDETLNARDIMRAKNLALNLAAAREGKVSIEIVKGMVEGSSTAVKQLFAGVIA